MVKGLDVFREHFRAYSDQYILIGGTACDLAMTEVGDNFRATKDLDIVLCVEALDAAFVKAFWDFVRSGGYNRREKASGQRRFYRFQKPSEENYPAMLELFSRKPDVLSLAEGSELTPIPMDEEVSSLSAILLDDGYYQFLSSGAKEKDGLRFVGPERLIPLKARAWMDLTKRKGHGEAVDEKDIKKHKNDVFRLYRIIAPAFGSEVPELVRGDMDTFLTRMQDENIDLNALGLGNAKKKDILADLRKIYCGG
ncbi:MAG: nucleotidyl transferase AbiEii/AbiGii toxin family protein [Planctomycetes bacterium]|nr:nucleotidyl transferase AbiEii/AbiGii toxin family protein [Planctomycetota bacterium]